MINPLRRDRKGFTLLEIVPVLAVIIMLFGIVIVAINPSKQFAQARNRQRQTHVAQIAEALHEYTRDQGDALLLRIPLAPASAIEICADTVLGNCSDLLDLSALVDTYLNAIPIDPSYEDNPIFDTGNFYITHSRYFAVRPSANRFTVSAPDTELGEAIIQVMR